MEVSVSGFYDFTDRRLRSDLDDQVRINLRSVIAASRNDNSRPRLVAALRQKSHSEDVQQSMSRRGNCWENAVAESFLATLKREETCVIYSTKRHAQLGIASYVHGFYDSS
ncbi:hypothetical protein ACLEJW_10000 [Pseudomonas sp. SMSB3]|uniref:hypothetical protein n=1 Tax=unclassified Pseudomonas TaxID=196821 RepID=UPI0028AA8D6E|nr:hypothetical protein [Pseudomonas sp.]